jgi:hypothetical protein
MIERNLGNIERVVRLFVGLIFGGWALMQSPMNGIDWFVVLVSLSLILNGVFSRCYFWYLLDIDTKKSNVDRSLPTSVC